MVNKKKQLPSENNIEGVFVWEGCPTCICISHMDRYGAATVRCCHHAVRNLRTALDDYAYI